jgi:hypothetical protein
MSPENGHAASGNANSISGRFDHGRYAAAAQRWRVSPDTGSLETEKWFKAANAEIFPYP